jgi:hypothetical protein
MAYNKKIHLRQNIDAIKVVLTIDKKQKMEVNRMLPVVRKYSGFGGIKAILNPADKPEDIRYWTKSDAELFPLVQELHEVLRDNSPTPEMYKRYVSSLKNSVLTGFYTPPPIVDTLMDVLHDYRIRPYNFLDPSAGAGQFINSFGKVMGSETNIATFEKDLLTGKILSYIYPHCKVRMEGYEKMEARHNGRFDMVASNIPFGDVAVFDPQLSNHEIPARRNN